MMVDSRATTPRPDAIASDTSSATTNGRAEDAGALMRGIVPQEGEHVLVACLGDVMLDVIVETDQPLTPDDDTPARITFNAGGQAANVATWVVALGGRARVFGPRAGTGSGQLVESALTDVGVEVRGSAS